jgi:hypothetical protein
MLVLQKTGNRKLKRGLNNFEKGFETEDEDDDNYDTEGVLII